MSFKFAATGDTVITGFFTKDYPGFKELAEIIRSADVRMNNMETTLLDGWSTVSAFSGGHWIKTPTTRLDDMEDFGFNCYSFANNHGLDYSYTGLLSTVNAFRERGLAFSGAGEDLATATKHCKVETPKGSLSFLAVTCTCDPSCIAGDPSGEIPGRPGLSMLRHSEKFFVTKEQLKQLEAIAEDTKVSGMLLNRRKLGSVTIADGVFPFGPIEFEVGEPGRMTYCNPYDLARLEKAVKAAVSDADRTVVYVHSHETKGDKEYEPDFFVEDFSRKAIDWGADAVIFSGTHQVKAVEFYKGKPIFYSMGNFYFRTTDLKYYPLEWFEKYKLDPALGIEGAERVRSKNGTIGLLTRPYNFRGIAPIIEWDEEGNILSVKAVPVGLGFKESLETTKGFPRIADDDDREALFKDLSDRSEPYGTKVSLGDDGLFLFEEK
ncbi:MAG: CapA family protein [Firmicutes bacterium]|nr:CapA family protein [Bacillota bacterium]